jgi:hypothetical protein
LKALCFISRRREAEKYFNQRTACLSKVSKPYIV